jgi:ADP-ribose pyrophosphatase YjhB (NUDIX family)
MQKTTLLYLHKRAEDQILLAMKKRRFGEGKWNGVGGKLVEGETIKQALVRETFEEIGVKINEDDLIQVATLEFSFENKSEWNQEVNVFMIEKWDGDPSESEEMKSEWFTIDKLPYDTMWVSDLDWLPLVLKGKKLSGHYVLDARGGNVLDKTIKEI